MPPWTKVAPWSKVQGLHLRPLRLIRRVLFTGFAIRVALRDLTMLASGGGQGTLFRIAERDLNECR